VHSPSLHSSGDNLEPINSERS